MPEISQRIKRVKNNQFTEELSTLSAFFMKRQCKLLQKLINKHCG
jgi:hypothetical protein